MKNIALGLILSLSVVTACSKKKVEKTTPTKMTTETAVATKPIVVEVKSPVQTPKVTVPEGTDVNLVAKIKRTPCFGKCPVFTIEMYNNGIVKYNGVAFVEKKGNFVAKANSDLIQQIQSKALAIKYLSFENKYPIAPVAIADLPTTTTYVRIGDVGKQILNNFDAPRELIEFENWLEQEFNKLDWKAE